MPLEQHLIRDSTGQYERTAWLLRGPSDRPHRLCIFLDAEHYLRDMDASPILIDLQARGEIPPVTCVFISHASGAARHEDLTWNDRYTRFIGEDVVQWANQHQPNLRSSDNVICGLSLSGLAGAHVALKYPQTFAYSLCQSASFWWKNAWLMEQFQALGPTRTRFWLSVGTEETAVGVSHPPSGLRQDMSQIEGVENAARQLKAIGAAVHYHLFTGGHAIAPWKAELPDAFRWLLDQA